MGQYHSTETPAEVRARFKARGRAQRVKVDLPVTLKYRFRRDIGAGYLDLTFDPPTLEKLKRICGRGTDDELWLQIRMLSTGLLHVKADHTGEYGYKLANGKTVQLPSLQVANIVEPPDDDAHAEGVVLETVLQWDNSEAFSINIPRTFFYRQERGGTGRKLRPANKQKGAHD